MTRVRIFAVIEVRIQSLYELGKKKSYEMLYHMSWGPNVFFVDAQYFDRFGIEDNSPSALWRELLPELLAKPENRYGRNGVPRPPGKDKLTWKNLEIPKRFRSDR